MKLPALISKLSTGPRTSADIDAEIAALDLRINQAQALAVALQAERGDVVRQGDIDALADHDTRARRAALEGEVLAAKLDDLKRQRADAARDEDEAARRSKFDAGRRAAARAKDILRNEYPDAAARIVDLLNRLKEAEEVIREANKNLPAGEAAIADPEQQVRGRPPRRGKTIVGTRTYRVRRGTNTPLIQWREDDPDVEVRTEEQLTRLPDEPAQYAVPLATSVALPAAAPESPPIWGPPAPVNVPFFGYARSR